MEPNSYPFQNYEMEAPFAASYPQSKQSNVLVHKCRFENIEFTQKVEEIVTEFQNKARNDPDYFSDNNSRLLVYWEDDRVWYHCKVLGYDKTSDKFSLKYDDGVLEQVSLWNETFITYDQFAQRKNDISANQYLQQSRDTLHTARHKERHARRQTRPSSEPKVGKVVGRTQVDTFLIIEKEYIASGDGSSISSDDMQYEEEGARAEYENAYMQGQNGNGKVYGVGQNEPNEGNHYPQDIMHSSGRFPTGKDPYNSLMMENSRQNFNQLKENNRVDESDSRMQWYSMEDNSNAAPKFGPFEITKAQTSRNQSLTDAMSVEK